jgi:Asp-tRNA(Asn)/Glu-tRNA(Gln) amidotransferase A subunit family amidase
MIFDLMTRGSRRDGGDHARRQGWALHGVPIAIKDNFDYKPGWSRHSRSR